MTTRQFAGLSRRHLLCLPLALAGCDEPTTSPRGRIDVAWHRTDLFDNLLNPWLEHAADPSGIFWSKLQRDWKTTQRTTVELTHQSRLVYAFAQGYEWSSDKRHLSAARRGADLLLQRFRDVAHGGFFHSLKSDGQPAALNKETYAQSFALLALATLARVDGNSLYREAALQQWKTISSHCIDPMGGVYKDLSREFDPHPGGRSQNPLMHLYEAVLALYTATGDNAALAGVRQIGDFVSNRLLQGLPDGGARIPEWYDEAWQPLPTREAGGYIEYGHQFEWAHLLASSEHISSIYSQVAERLMIYALGTGFDEHRGGCYGRAYPDADKPDTAKGWWQQAECVHALVVCAHAWGRTDLWRRYDQTLSLVRDELIDPYQGGWQQARFLPCKNGGCDNEQPDPYHMVAMHSAALRAASA